MEGAALLHGTRMDPVTPSRELELAIAQDGNDADDELEQYPDESDTTSSWSELESPGQISQEDEDGDYEYNEEEFRGILSLSERARGLYATTAILGDLEDSIAYLRDALTVAPPDHLVRGEVLHLLAYDLYTLSRATEHAQPQSQAAVESLTDSIRLHRQALKLLPNDAESRGLYITRLAVALRERYLRALNPVDIDESIQLHTDVLSLRPPGHADRGQSLVNLANASWTRFEHGQKVSDLQQAIECDSEVLELRLPGHPDRLTALTNLATDIAARYRSLEAPPDLDALIVLRTEALSLSMDDQLRSTTSLQLASHLTERYMASRNFQDRDDALRILGQDKRPSDVGGLDIVHRLQIRSELCLVSGIGLLGYSNLDEAILLLRSCMEHPTARPDVLLRLAHTLVIQSQPTSLPMVDEIVTLTTRAIDLCPPGHPYRSTGLRLTAHGYLRKYGITHAHEDLQHSYVHFAKAAMDHCSSLRDRLVAAGEWIELGKTARRPDWTLEAYTTKVFLLSIFSFLPQRASDSLLWHGVDNLGTLAASCALEISDSKEAASALERGKELYWWNKLRRKMVDDDLTARVSATGARVGQVEKALLPTQSGISISELPTLEPCIVPNHLLADQFLDLLEQLPKAYNNLGFGLGRSTRTAWDRGPVVFLLERSRQCEALVVRTVVSAALRITLPIPLLALQDLETNFRKCKSHSESELHHLLRQLWEGIVKPIIDGLNITKREGRMRSRIWWCPSGLFSGLPLHAAGIYDGHVTCLSDYVISSYTPSVNALCRSRKGCSAYNIPDRVLVVRSNAVDGSSYRRVDPPQTPCETPKTSQPALQAYKAEVTASRSAILKAASRSFGLHITALCSIDHDSPENSGFVLPDGKLTTSDFMSLGSRVPQFVYVVQSQTATDHFADRMSIYTGLLQVGFQYVVGTLWEVPEREEKLVSEEFYKEVLKPQRVDRSSAAYALDLAVQRLREQGAPSSVWVSYVHVGY